MFFEPAPTAFDLNFRLFGVWVRVHPMHWLVSVLLGPSLKDSIGLVLGWVICVFLSILLHEMGHIMMGRVFGSDGHIVLYSFGGLAIPDEPVTKRYQRILVSFAGPLVQLVLAAVLIGAGLIARQRGYQAPANVQEIYKYLLVINLFWALLNLLPIWPLDGGRIAREICTWCSSRYGIRASLILSLCVAGFLAVVCLAAYFKRPILPYTEVVGDLFMGLFFAFFAVGSFMALGQEAPLQRKPSDEAWRETDDDGEAWKR
jgi:stage IV sporulation protein FB